MSNSLVTLADGAFAFNHCLKSFRSADSCARYDFVVLLEKSIFFPGAGFVFTYVASGSPLSMTSALPVSIDGLLTPSVALPPPDAAPAVTIAKSATKDSEARSFFKFLPFRSDPYLDPAARNPGAPRV